MLQKVRHKDKLCVAVIPRHELPGFLHKLRRQQRQDIQIPVTVSEAPDILSLKRVIVMKLTDFQDIFCPVFGQRQIILMPCGDDDPFRDVSDHLSHGPAFSGEDAYAPHRLLVKSAQIP